MAARDAIGGSLRQEYWDARRQVPRRIVLHERLPGLHLGRVAREEHTLYGLLLLLDLEQVVLLPIECSHGQAARSRCAPAVRRSGRTEHYRSSTTTKWPWPRASCRRSRIDRHRIARPNRWLALPQQRRRASGPAHTRPLVPGKERSVPTLRVPPHDETVARLRIRELASGAHK